MGKDSARERNLYKYFQPWIDIQSHDDVKSGSPDSYGRVVGQDGDTPRPSPDNALTAFTQLAALRLNVRRCMVSLIDSSHQFILAEATKSLSLRTGKAHAEDDQLWLGNTVIARSAAICPTVFGSSYTAKDRNGNTYTTEAFVVDDLSKDSRFRDRSYVKNEPCLRFYAGVPIFTSSGHKIGVYAVMSEGIREGLNVDELKFMQDMGVAVMEHFEMIKSRNDRTRGDQMVRGLASFIETISSTETQTWGSDADARFPGSSATSPVPEILSDSFAKMSLDQKPASTVTGDAISPIDAPTKRSRPSSVNYSSIASQAGQPSDQELSISIATNGPRDPKDVFALAAHTIRDTTAADGVVFFDAKAGAFGRQQLNGEMEPDREPPTPPISDGDPLLPNGGRSESKVYCDVLGFAVKTGPNVSALSQSMLEEQRLDWYLQKFPLGKIFRFAESGSVSSGDESTADASRAKAYASQGRKKSIDVATMMMPSELTKLFPGVRSAVFLPLWDFAQERFYAGGFIWTTRRGRLEDAEDELPFLKAFGNSIMSEVARLQVMKASLAKTTFIASISHELRSPLHGILGSTEFLHETALDAVQLSLITSIETCGKTLLDTIDHVLAYAKINSFRKPQIGDSATPSNRHSRKASLEDQPTSQSLETDFHLGQVLEEAVESVFAGQTFERSRSGQHDHRSIPTAFAEMKAIAADDSLSRDDAVMKGSKTFSGQVALVLNIKPMRNWNVSSEAGAFKRVITNLVGNSLKYTAAGFVEVSLSAKEDLLHGKMTLQIKCVDSGKGMSPEFQRTRLFRPFSQEDPFTPGTGLGLSIVRQLVDSLDGNIHIQSQQNVGTEVAVSLTLPMVQTPKFSTEAQDDISESLLNLTRGRKVCVLDPSSKDDNGNPNEKKSRVIAALRDTLEGWFGMEVECLQNQEGSDADFFLFPEPPPVGNLLEQDKDTNTKDGKIIPFIIICTNAFEAAALRTSGIQRFSELGRIVEVIAQPCGPSKLAQVLHQCTRRINDLHAERATNESNHRPVDLKPFLSETVTIPHDQVSDHSLDVTPKIEPISQRPTNSREPPEVGVKYSQQEPENAVPPILTGKPVPSLHYPQASPEPPNDPQGRPEASSPTSKQQIQANPQESQPPITTSIYPLPSLAAPLVLLVDDNAINLQLLQTFMRKSAFPFISAVNGLEAVEGYKSAPSKPDYILMDISMPIMDGLTATREIRKLEASNGINREERSVVVALTGLADQATREEARRSGVDHFMSKPVKFRDLRGLLVQRKGIEVEKKAH